MKYQVTDGNEQLEIEAESAQDACQIFVDGCDWGSEATSWVEVTATEIDPRSGVDGESETHIIEIPPTEPRCRGGGDHDWVSPMSVVGGSKENPGVCGHGGGVVITCVCRHCGRYQVIDTWAQNTANGQEGYSSVSYRDSDSTSEAWLYERSMARA